MRENAPEPAHDKGCSVASGRELTMMRERAAGAKVAHLATVRPDGTPHLVPCCFSSPKLDLFDTSVARAYRNRIGIALVQVPLCSFFNAVSTVFVWAITSAEFSVWMKCPPSVL